MGVQLGGDDCLGAIDDAGEEGVNKSYLHKYLNVDRDMSGKIESSI